MTATPPALPPSPWLASPRLRLREFANHDVQHIIHMHHEPYIRAWLIDDQPLNEPHAACQFVAGMQAFYRQYEGTGIWCAERAMPPDADNIAEARAAFAAGDIGQALLAQVEAPTWHFIGWFSLVHLQDTPNMLEIGSRLLPEVWGSRLVLDGGEWLLARAFEDLGHMCVYAHCHPSNRSAENCLRILGFSDAGETPYNGYMARRFALTRPHWHHWRRLSRREQIRQTRTPQPSYP